MEAKITTILQQVAISTLKALTIFEYEGHKYLFLGTSPQVSGLFFVMGLDKSNYNYNEITHFLIPGTLVTPIGNLEITF